jgi:hypothetical protein
MKKKKSPNKVPAPAKNPVLHGDTFRAFIDEARSIGNEVAARRQLHADMMEFLGELGYVESWDAWYAKKRAKP